MALVAAKSRCLRPILTFDVIDHGALFPSQERRDYQTDALAAARGREGENVFRSVVTEVIQSASALGTPAADIDAVPCGEQPGVAHVVLVCPSRGTMQFL